MFFHSNWVTALESNTSLPSAFFTKTWKLSRIQAVGLEVDGFINGSTNDGSPHQNQWCVTQGFLVSPTQWVCYDTHQSSFNQPFCHHPVSRWLLPSVPAGYGYRGVFSTRREGGKTQEDQNNVLNLLFGDLTAGQTTHCCWNYTTQDSTDMFYLFRNNQKLQCMSLLSSTMSLTKVLAERYQG